MISRVLRPGRRFSATQFIAELDHRGIDVGSNFVTRCFGDVVIGVGPVTSLPPSSRHVQGAHP